MSTPLREIHVFVRDASGRLLDGSDIAYTEDGADRGGVPASDGHGVFRTPVFTSTITVTVTYGGEVKSRKLAVTEKECTIVFVNVHPPATPSPAPAPAPVPPPSGGWLNSTVLAALVTGVLGLAGIYWQFIHKPAQEAVLNVQVFDARSGQPLERAIVVLERVSTAPQQKQTDGLGAVQFTVTRGESEMRLRAQADGFEHETRAVDAPQATVRVELQLRPKAVAVVPPPATAPSDPLRGTWLVVGNPNPVLNRLTDGSISFTPQADGRILVAGRFKLDKIETQIKGTAGRRNAQVFVEFEAAAGTSSWKGRGTWKLLGSQQLEGQIEDAKGEAVAVVLKRV